MASEQQIKAASGINIVAGIWLILAPFLLGFSGTALSRNDVIFGIVVGILALARVGMTEESNSWLSWLAAIFGVWVLVSPFFLGYISLAGLWNNIIVGIIIAAMGVWSASVTSSREHPKAV